MGEPPPRDEYEVRFMDAGRSLARAKMRVPWYMLLWFALPIAALWVGGVRAGTPVMLLRAGLVTLFAALVALVFSTVRISVTAGHVHVQQGVFGPKIPIGRIVRCVEDTVYVPSFFAWGIKWIGFGKWAYLTPSAGGRGVLIEYDDAAGARRAVFVSCNQAAEIVAAIEGARAGAAGTGVRVADERPAAHAEAPDGGGAAASRRSSRGDGG